MSLEKFSESQKKKSLYEDAKSFVRKGFMAGALTAAALGSPENSSAQVNPDFASEYPFPGTGAHRFESPETFDQSREEALANLRKMIERKTELLETSHEEFVSEFVNNWHRGNLDRVAEMAAKIENDIASYQRRIAKLENFTPEDFLEGIRDIVAQPKEEYPLGTMVIAIDNSHKQAVENILFWMEKEKIPYELPTIEELDSLGDEYRQSLIRKYEDHIESQQKLADDYRNNPDTYIIPTKEWEERAEKEWNDIDHERLKYEVEEAKKDIIAVERWFHPEILTQKIDSLHAWVIHDISSPEYLDKLQKEGYSLRDAQDIIQERVERLTRADYSIDFSYLGSSHYEPYAKETGLVTFNAFDAARYLTAIHEFQHQATEGEFEMSKHAVELYGAGVVSQEEFAELVNNNQQLKGMKYDYLSNVSELDARKKVLEYEMETLGIKKKGEAFTNEHRDIIWGLFKEGKLSLNSMQVMLLLKPEFLNRVLNEVADADVVTPYDLLQERKNKNEAYAQGEQVQG